VRSVGASHLGNLSVERSGGFVRRIHLATAAVLALTLVAAACGDDDSGSTTSSTTTSTSTTTATTTTTAATTTTTVATTTTPSTTPPSSTTTTVPPTTTTTTTPPPPPLVFEPDGIGIAQFGDDPAIVLGQLETIFGAPTFDTGWIAGGFGDYGVCPGTEFRRVEFIDGEFVVHFADGNEFGPAGTRVFYYYAYSGGAPGPTLGPPSSIDAGTSVSDLQSIWPSVELFDDDPFFGSTYRVDAAGANQLWGRLTGTAPTDQIISVTGGRGCGE
jgi:hypothetical protein